MNIELFGITLTIDESYIAEPADTITEQLTEYETGSLHTFDLTVQYPDDFTGRVMRQMDRIPYGETRTYGDIATALHTAPIAVGQACGRNPIPIIVPCHRVTSKTGLGGYSAGGDNNLTLKQHLLTHETSPVPQP